MSATNTEQGLTWWLFVNKFPERTIAGYLFALFNVPVTCPYPVNAACSIP